MRWLLAVLLLCGFATPGLAQDTVSAAPAEPRCSISTNPPATSISAVIARGPAALGQCVRLTGWFDGRRLFADQRALYRQREWQEPLNRHADQLPAYDHSAAAPHHAELTLFGRVRDCANAPTYPSEALPGREAFEPINTACLGGSTYYLEITDFNRWDDLPFVRMPASGRQSGWGNLSPLAPSLARDRLLAAGARFFSVLADRDEAALQTLLANGAGRPASAFNAQFLGSQTRDAIDMWRGSGPALEVFGWVPPADSTEQQRATWQAQSSATSDGIVCASSPDFARQNLWPIDEYDTHIVGQRPYVCVRIELRTNGTPLYEVRMSDEGLPEP
jgi:hypothetical protein